MIVVESGKEFSLTTTTRDYLGQLADAEEHEIILYTPNGMPFITLTTPEHLSLGEYRATFIFPDDAEEGIWRIYWMAIINGRPATEIVEIKVQWAPPESAKILQIGMMPQDTTLLFGKRSLAILHKSMCILVDPEKLVDDTMTILTHAHTALQIKGQKCSIAVHVNKFTNKLLSKEDYPIKRKIFWKRPFFIGDVKITPFPVVHSVKAPMTGLVLEANSRKIIYLPDVLDILDRKVLNGADVYIGDGVSLDKDLIRRWSGKKYGHASIRTQLSWVRDAKIPKAIFTNLGKWAGSRQIARKVLQSLNEEFNLKVAESYRDYRIHLGKTIRLQRDLLTHWEPENQLPYVLSLHAVKNSWIPPHNISALPKSIRINIPTRYIYWLKNNTHERLATRDRLVKALQMDEVQVHGISLQDPPEIEEPIDAKATLQHRGGTKHEERWDLHVGELLHFVLQSNPIDSTSTPAVYKPSVEQQWMGITILEEVKSSEEIETFIRTIDRGTVRILGSGAGFVRVHINMSKLKGIYTFTRCDRMNLWMMGKEEES